MLQCLEMSETNSSVNDGSVRTSELIAQDGMEVVGDSTRRMTILEEARKNGKLIKDGDPSDIFKKLKKFLSVKITP